MWFIGVEVEQETSAPPPRDLNLDLINTLKTLFRLFRVLLDL